MHSLATCVSHIPCLISMIEDVEEANLTKMTFLVEMHQK